MNRHQEVLLAKLEGPFLGFHDLYLVGS